MRQDLTLKAYQLENSCHEVHDYSAVYDFRHFINKITKYSHLIKFNCAGGRFNCWTEGSRGETTKWNENEHDSYDMSHIIWLSIIEYFSISMKSYKSPHFSWNMGSEISGKIIGVITIGRMRLWKLNKMNFTCSLLLFDCFAVLGQGSMDWLSENWLWTLQGALIKKIGCLVALAEKHVMDKMRDYHFHTI